MSRDRYSDDHTIETIGQKEGEFGFHYGSNITLRTEAGGNLSLKTGGGSGDYNAFGGKVLIGVGDSFAHGTSSIELGEEYYDDGVDQYKISNMHIYSEGSIHIGKDSDDNGFGPTFLYSGTDSYARVSSGQFIIHNSDATSEDKILFEVESNIVNPAFTVDKAGDVFCAGSIGGDSLTVTGAIGGDSLTVTGAISGGSLSISNLDITATDLKIELADELDSSQRGFINYVDSSEDPVGKMVNRMMSCGMSFSPLMASTTKAHAGLTRTSGTQKLRWNIGDAFASSAILSPSNARTVIYAIKVFGYVMSPIQSPQGSTDAWIDEVQWWSFNNINLDDHNGTALQGVTAATAGEVTIGEAQSTMVGDSDVSDRYACSVIFFLDDSAMNGAADIAEQYRELSPNRLCQFTLRMAGEWNTTITAIEVWSHIYGIHPS
jgi:hypothetical protein